MTRQRFLVVTALVELGAGLSLLAAPAVLLALLLGVRAPAPETLVAGRVAGVALVALGLAAGLARDDADSGAARGVAIGLLVYDAGAAALLAYTGAVLGLSGGALWPAAALHAALALWGVGCLAGQGRR